MVQSADGGRLKTGSARLGSAWLGLSRGGGLGGRGRGMVQSLKNGLAWLGAWPGLA